MTGAPRVIRRVRGRHFSNFLKGLFGKNGTVPLGECFCCENGLPSVLKRKKRDDLYDMGEWN